MATRTASFPISGGIRLSPRLCRRWQPDPRQAGVSQPVRCAGDQWYCLHGSAAVVDSVHVIVEFLDAARALVQRAVQLEPVTDRANVFGWVQSPPDAKSVRIRLVNPAPPPVESLEFHAIAERDPKCHPFANLPRPTLYKPPFPLDRIVLPPTLESLRDGLPGVEITKPPKSLRDLAARAVGAAIVLDPEWIRSLHLSMADLERVIPLCYMIVDLESLAGLLSAAGVRTRCLTRADDHAPISARVEYADVATRGFALLDVFPYGWYSPPHRFSARVLEATRDWKRYADETGFAMLLSSQTQSEARCNDVIAASRPLGNGELVATDLPWLAAGLHGPLAAPDLTRVLLASLFARPVDDWAQYWNRWDDIRIVVRDIADLARRFSPLRPVRWASPDRSRVVLGLALEPRPHAANGDGKPRRHILLKTGRIDNLEPHTGLPAEPMMIVMKMLAREVREDTAWARRHLEGVAVTWQFETAGGQRYATLFDAPTGAIAAPPTDVYRLGVVAPSTSDLAQPAPAGDDEYDLTLPASAGFLGDRAHAWQERLNSAIRRWITLARP
ncbi:MAG: hypothetical protein AMXMBFR47_10980 [Planctomycetota bacterium]